MNIEVQGINVSINESVHQFIQRKVMFGLKKYEDAIRRIIIRLTDINGPKSGKDKCCHIPIIIPKVNDLIIEDTEVDIYKAINRAVERAGRIVNKRLTKKALFKRT